MLHKLAIIVVYLLIQSKATTIVGICCRDGVVLGADSRATGGDIVRDKNKLKVHMITPQQYCCAAGSVADCEQITRNVKQILQREQIECELGAEDGHLNSIFSVKARIINAFLRGINGRSVDSAMILGGIDHFGPSLHQITTSGVLRTSCCALGSGQIDALSTLEAYRSKWGPPIETWHQEAESNALVENVSVEEAIVVIRESVKSGVMNDLGSGSFIDICVIKESGDVQKWREDAQGGEVVTIGLAVENGEKVLPEKLQQRRGETIRITSL